MDDLAPRQRALLDFIAAYQDQKGIPPTIREIGEALGIRSTNGVSDHIKALVKKGYLERVGDARASRGVKLSQAARGGFREEATVAVPLLGRVAAGSPVLAEENYAATLHLDSAMLPHNAAAFALTVTASVKRPLRLAFEGLPGRAELVRALDDAVPDALYHDDVHGRPDWRRHMTRHFAEEIRGSLDAAPSPGAAS